MSSLNALFKKWFFTFGNLSLYTWFIIIISLSKETGERPGLEEKRNHVIIYRYHTRTFQNPGLIIMLPHWLQPFQSFEFNNVQMLNFREDPGKQWQSAVSWGGDIPVDIPAPTGSGRNPPISFPVNANPKIEACKTPSAFIADTFVIPLILWLPSMAVGAALLQKKSQWALESPGPERNRKIGSQEVEMICFLLSEGYCMSTVIQLDLTYKINTTGNKDRALL